VFTLSVLTARFVFGFGSGSVGFELAMNPNTEPCTPNCESNLNTN
jgi:hypothetical protein